jgi:hypothetical protein
MKKKKKNQRLNTSVQGVKEVHVINLITNRTLSNKHFYIHCPPKLSHNFKTRVFEPNLFPVTTFRTVKY